MSSTFNPKLEDLVPHGGLPVGEPAPPLPEGHYYLVDISEPLTRYMQNPKEVRMCAISDGDVYNDADMVDIELSSIIPCLDAEPVADREMKEHIEDLLDDGREQIAFMMRESGIDTETRTVLNTPEQLAHAKAIDELGKQLYEIFVEHKLYNENGRLLGEHCTLLQGGVLVLRES
jgi:hypothetical protein